METTITIKCICKKKVMLEVYGGQYQNEYRGKCECGREWVLTEISELMAEIDDC
jgi:hypothetical protein